MSVSQVSNAVAASGSAQIQAAGGHHHRRSISDQINQMGSAIDNAVNAGTMTSDQATSLKKDLADVTQTLKQSSTGASGTTGANGQSNQLSQLSDADRKKVLGELQDVRQQLFSANPQNANSSSGSGNNTNSGLTGHFSISA